MSSTGDDRRGVRPRRYATPLRALHRALPGVALALLVGCAGAANELPDPRPIVIYSGARIQPDAQRMDEIGDWTNDAVRTVQEDPSFLISGATTDRMLYPWNGVTIQGDTATYSVDRAQPEAGTAYQIYGFLYLMKDDGRLDEWLPEAVGLEGFALEREVLSQVADVWLFGRSVFATAAYDPLDEILYAKENGYLEALILTARPDEFEEARREWLDDNPDGIEEYRRWFVDTFEREPPGLRVEEEEAAPAGEGEG